MTQTRKMSFIESICNVGSGFIIAMIVWRTIVTPLLDIPVSYSQNFKVTLIFTVVSILRCYVWRRLFDRRVTDGAA